MMKVTFKKLHEKAVLPKYAKPGDAAMDLTVTEVFETPLSLTYKFGIAVEIPEGYVGLIFPRSSCYKLTHSLSNSVGVIDSGYRGEISAVFYHNKIELKYNVGERAAQLLIIPYPQIEPQWAETLSKTERGTGGFGHTGK